LRDGVVSKNPIDTASEGLFSITAAQKPRLW
jgi:hypothetical protein